jgi:NAD(P)-dependent dehydrogenase (short-subunit alcohol dehydrogenase family)
MNPIFDLSGKTALITGSSRGIGRAMGITFAQAGANVIVHGIHLSKKLNKTVAEIKQSGGNAIGIAGDLSKSEEIAELIINSHKAFGSIDILILNASRQSYMTVEEFEKDEFKLEYDVNLKSSFELIKAVLPDMKIKKWGRVLAIGSINQWKQSPRLAIYSTTKSAQVNLIMNCAREYSKYGITFNNLAPGVITTDRNAETLADETIRQRIFSMIPAKRFGKPADCTGPALLLCSEAGSYITGTDLPVTGGMHL